ncbi:Protein kinase, ATP binding site [Phytophthora cactorum]|nr:Protein kinase, ATP binding site [Phytophthora cactorum]
MVIFAALRRIFCSMHRHCPDWPKLRPYEIRIGKESASTVEIDRNKMTGDEGVVVPHNVFAKLPSYNPFVGTFHHAPSAGNRGAVYFSSDIVDMAELEERKKFRHHPLTGIFHSLPGYYDPLHKWRLAAADGDADPFFNGNKTGSPNNKKDGNVEYHDELTDSDVDEDIAALAQQEPRSLPLNILSVTDKYDVPPPVGALPPRRTPYKKARKSSEQPRTPAKLKLQRSLSEGDSDDDINDEYTQAAPRIPANPFVARRLNDGDELRIMAIHRTGRRDSQALKNDHGESDSEDEYNHPKPYFIHEKAVTEQYELVGEDQLGDGSYAVVKPAIRRVNGKEVAIKQIHKRFLRDEAAKNAVSREIEIHLRLRHKHIATKGNLKALMQRKRMLPEALGGKLSQQIVRAVLFLHDMGVLHCDLKPDNILLSDAKTASQDNGESSPTMRRNSPPKSTLDPHADVKLTGDVHKVPFTGVTGTSGYIAPELLQQQSYGKPVDMWSVGIIIFEMLTGYQPFYPPHACIEEDADFSDRVWKTISADAKDLVQRLLERDPAKRLTAAEALAHSWFESAMFAI